jgi:hypothetical protein
MAPLNPYLNDPEIRQRLRNHNARLIKKTTIEWEEGVEPEEHWDFQVPVETGLLAPWIDAFAAPDFDAGKVKASPNAVITAYGYEDDYLLNRIIGYFTPGSKFNEKHAVNGLVYAVNPTDLTIVRADRKMLAERELVVVQAKREAVHTKTNAVTKRALDTAARKYKRINPAGLDELEAKRGEIETGLMKRIQDDLSGDS